MKKFQLPTIDKSYVAPDRSISRRNSLDGVVTVTQISPKKKQQGFHLPSIAGGKPQKETSGVKGGGSMFSKKSSSVLPKLSTPKSLSKQSSTLIIERTKSNNFRPIDRTKSDSTNAKISGQPKSRPSQQSSLKVPKVVSVPQLLDQEDEKNNSTKTLKPEVLVIKGKRKDKKINHSEKRIFLSKLHNESKSDSKDIINQATNQARNVTDLVDKNIADCRKNSIKIKECSEKISASRNLANAEHLYNASRLVGNLGMYSKQGSQKRTRWQ